MYKDAKIMFTIQEFFTAFKNSCL